MADESEAAPQGLEEKIAAPRASSDTVARQTLASLRNRLWSPQGLASSYKTIPAPQVLRFLVMDKIEQWERQGGSNGEATVYALTSSGTVKHEAGPLTAKDVLAQVKQ